MDDIACPVHGINDIIADALVVQILALSQVFAELLVRHKSVATMTFKSSGNSKVAKLSPLRGAKPQPQWPTSLAGCRAHVYARLVRAVMGSLLVVFPKSRYASKPLPILTEHEMSNAFFVVRPNDHRNNYLLDVLLCDGIPLHRNPIRSSGAALAVCCLQKRRASPSTHCAPSLRRKSMADCRCLSCL